jgi:hypothetical protein
MSFWLWEIAKDPAKREALKWLGGGVAAVGIAIWTIFIFIADRSSAVEAQRHLLELTEKIAAANAEQARALNDLARLIALVRH